MKKQLLIILGILFSIHGFCQNGKIYGVVQTSRYKWSFCKYDSASQSTSNLDSIPGMDGVVTATNLIDPVRGIYYFQGLQRGDANYYMYSVNIGTGKFIKRQKTKSKYGLMQPAYNRKTMEMYGLQKVNSVNNGFSRMDLINDSVVLIDTIPNLLGNYGGNFGIVGDRNEYFMEGIDRNKKSYLYIFDIPSGKVKFKILMNDSQSVGSLNYSTSQGKYFIMSYFNKVWYVGSFDSSHGIKYLDSIPGFKGYYYRSANYDNFDNRLMVKGIQSGTANAYLYGIDCSTGHVLTKNLMDSTSPDIFNLFTGFDFILNGKISTHSGGALKSSKAYLCSYNATDTIVNVLDSTMTDTSGNYSFTTTDTSVYVFAFPDKTSYPNELPTWADSGMDFQDANAVNLKTTSTKTFNTLYGTNPGGGGFIGGKINYCNLCKTSGSGTPVENLRVILADANGRAQAYTYTDKNGAFSFKNLAISKYKIKVDRPKIDNGSAPMITLTDSIRTLDKLGLTLYATYLSLTTMNGIESTEVNGDAVHIYPNPFNKELNINYSSSSGGKVIIQISDIMGRCAYRKEISGTSLNATLNIDASYINNGTYFIQLITPKVVITEKMIKTGE